MPAFIAHFQRGSAMVQVCIIAKTLSEAKNSVDQYEEARVVLCRGYVLKRWSQWGDRPTSGV